MGKHHCTHRPSPAWQRTLQVRVRACLRQVQCTDKQPQAFLSPSAPPPPTRPLQHAQSTARQRHYVMQILEMKEKSVNQSILKRSVPQQSGSPRLSWWTHQAVSWRWPSRLSHSCSSGKMESGTLLRQPEHHPHWQPHGPNHRRPRWSELPAERCQIVVKQTRGGN